MVSISNVDGRRIAEIIERFPNTTATINEEGEGPLVACGSCVESPPSILKYIVVAALVGEYDDVHCRWC